VGDPGRQDGLVLPRSLPFVTSLDRASRLYGRLSVRWLEPSVSAGSAELSHSVAKLWATGGYLTGFVLALICSRPRGIALGARRLGAHGHRFRTDFSCDPRRLPHFGARNSRSLLAHRLRNSLGDPIGHHTSHDGEKQRGCEELAASTPLWDYLTLSLLYWSQIVGNIPPNPIEKIGRRLGTADPGQLLFGLAFHVPVLHL
jgi:hypothetical protein